MNNQIINKELQDLLKQYHADDMYYMLSDIKNLLEECKNLL